MILPGSELGVKINIGLLYSTVHGAFFLSFDIQGREYVLGEKYRKLITWSRM